MKIMRLKNVALYGIMDLHVYDVNTVYKQTSSVAAMLPDTSMQKTMIAADPVAAEDAAFVAPDFVVGGVIAKVVSSPDGISSRVISTTFLVPQNSHIQS